MSVDFDVRGQQEEALLWIMELYFVPKQQFKVKTS